MMINKTGFNGYLKPRIEKIKKIKQGIQTEEAVEFEKDKNQRERNNFSNKKQNSKEEAVVNDEFIREDNELINITA